MNGLLCLKWNNHSSAFYKTLNNHRTKELYCDTTIACRGKYYPVHRLVLTTCSEYFEEIFERTQCKHPFIIIKDIQPSELEALLNYMYKGEVNVLQDMLPGLIKAAESLKIRGLAVPDDGDSSEETKDKKRCYASSPPPYVKRSRKNIRKPNRQNERRLSISPIQSIEVEPEVIPIEENNSSPEENQETSLPALNSTSTSNSVLTNSKPVVTAYEQKSGNSNSNYSHEESSSTRPKSKGNSEDLRDDDNIELEDVKVEALELVPLEDVDENNYPLSESEIDAKSETEGSLFQTLLGGDDTSINKKTKNSNNNGSHPVAQCSTWDDNMEHSNDDSHLNSEEMQDEIHSRLRKSGNRFKPDVFQLDMLVQDKYSQNSSVKEQDRDWWEQKNLKKCPECCYTSKYKSNLTTHILRKHTTELGFSCGLCEYQCSTNGALKIHSRKHTGEKPYACQFCPFRARYYDGFKKHMMIHSGIKPFKCNICDYSTSQKHTLTRHLKMYHSGEIVGYEIDNNSVNYESEILGLPSGGFYDVSQ